MFYGRRRIDPGLVKTPRKRKWIIDRNFQLHYTSYLTMAVAGSCLLAFGAVFYFVNQNYQIFTALAFDTHPGLVLHLEREVAWLRFFILVSFALISGVTFFLTLKMTRKLIEPLARMEKHMRSLTQGLWNTPDLVDSEKDFNELLTTYDYFYRSLKIMTESELELLSKLNIDPANREAFAAWKTLLENKHRRLGKNPNVRIELKAVPTGTAAKTDEPPHLRRVS